MSPVLQTLAMEVAALVELLVMLDEVLEVTLNIVVATELVALEIEVEVEDVELDELLFPVESGALTVTL